MSKSDSTARFPFGSAGASKSGTLRIVAGLVLAGVALAGCQSGNDAPVVGGNEAGDHTPAEIVAMPDGFSNVASKCDPWGNRIYTMYHGGSAYGSVFVVPQDKSCGPK